MSDKKKSAEIMDSRRTNGPGSMKNLGGKKVRAKDSKGTIIRLWDYLAQERWLLALVMGLVIISTITGVIGPYFVSMVIDDFIQAGIKNGLLEILGFMLLIYAFGAIATYLQQFIMVKVAGNAVQRIRVAFFQRLQSFSLKFFDQHANGDLMSQMTNDIENVQTALDQNIALFMGSTLKMIGIVIVMIVLSWRLAIVALLTVPVVILVTRAIIKVTRKGYRGQQKHLGDLNGLIEETLNGLKVVKVYGNEVNEVNKFKEKNQALKKAALKANIYGGFMGPNMNLLNNLRFALIAGFGGYFALNGHVSVGVIAAFLNYSKQLGRPIAQLANVYNTIQSAVAGAERVFKTMDEVPEIIDASDCESVERFEGEVGFESVNFGYVKGVQVLKEADFSIKQGETIAIVGPTGAGKTTIINLLTRFYDVNSGRITIDGKDIKHIQKDSLRQNLGIVLQDTYLFSATVRENIRYGRLDASDEDIYKAARMANAHFFIEHLPDGYDTLLSHEGSNLSQGQKQLIAIARAILSDPSILILDEATSSVDTRTEQHIQKAMLKLMVGRTSFVIAHRLSTIVDADRIMVMQDGVIIESGNHEKLLELEGFYHKLFTSQFKKAV